MTNTDRSAPVPRSLLADIARRNAATSKSFTEALDMLTNIAKTNPGISVEDGLSKLLGVRRR